MLDQHSEKIKVSVMLMNLEANSYNESELLFEDTNIKRYFSTKHANWTTMLSLQEREDN